MDLSQYIPSAKGESAHQLLPYSVDKNSILRNSIRFTQILTAPEMDIAVAKLLNSLIMLLVIRRVKKAGIFLCNEKRSSVIHLHRRFKQQKQIVPAASGRYIVS